MPAKDFRWIKLSDQEKILLREISAERDASSERRSAQRRIEEAPLVEELRQATGFDIKSVWDLVNMSAPYPDAIPVLIDHLGKEYSDEIRDGIARALAVRDARSAWPILVEAYRRAPLSVGLVAPDGVKEFRSRAKDGLAAALSAVATEDKLEELISLLKDTSLGESRILLLRALKRSRKRSAADAIAELARDPALSKEIASWRPRRPVGRGRPH